MKMKMKMVVILPDLMVMLMDWVVNRKIMVPTKVGHCLIWWNIQPTDAKSSVLVGLKGKSACLD